MCIYPTIMIYMRGKLFVTRQFIIFNQINIPSIETLHASKKGHFLKVTSNFAPLQTQKRIKLF